jgi:signal peptidase I
MKLSSKVFRDLVTTGVMLIGVFAFRSSVAEPYVVPTGSMKPSILPGDYLFVSKLSYDLKVPFTDLSLVHIQEPKRGDVVVFKYPRDPSINFVKRLIGLPGDEIVVQDGFIQINGSQLPISPKEQESLVEFSFGYASAEIREEQIGETHHSSQRISQRSKSEIMRFKVPAENYFFMGDNRDDSNDSRAWGFVPKSYLKGKAKVVWLSLDKKNLVPDVRWDRIGTVL